MILTEIDKFRKNKDLFELTANYKGNWDEYLSQYQRVILLVTNKAEEKRYLTNPRAFPFLFLIRHFVELLLKKNLIDLNIQFGKIHNLNNLKALFPENELPDELSDAITQIDLDDDGSIFRYFTSKNGDLYQLDPKEVKAYHFFDHFNKIDVVNKFYKEISTVNVCDKYLQWEYTFHTNEISSDAKFRSQYDDLIVFIINSIIDTRITVNDIYIPFIFLIRHSVELGLKDSLISLVHIEQDENKREKLIKKIRNEHSLLKLFNVYFDLLEKIDTSQLESALKNQYDNYLAKFRSLNDSLHLLDNNSRYFRYPIDTSAGQNMPLSKNSIIDITELFISVDPFITFNVDLLKDSGLVSYTNDEMYAMMGYPEIY